MTSRDVTPVVEALLAGTATAEQQADAAGVILSLIRDADDRRQTLAKVMETLQAGWKEYEEMRRDNARMVEELDRRMAEKESWRAESGPFP